MITEIERTMTNSYLLKKVKLAKKPITHQDIMDDCTSIIQQSQKQETEKLDIYSRILKVVFNTIEIEKKFPFTKSIA